MSDSMDSPSPNKKITFKLKREEENSAAPETINFPSSSSSSSLSSSSSSSSSDDEIVQSHLKSKELVLYDPLAAADAAASVALATRNESGDRPISSPIPNQHTPRVLPSVGAFTVQCANCFKWRLIPTKDKYEQIREHILERPFYCETAREWRPHISCDDPPDIQQDGSRLWAIDKPNIAQPPPGWQRLLRIRGEGSTKFADVYYEAPSGKKLRSMVEIQKYLMEHPEYLSDGVTMSQFSFQIPRPLQENYVRKRPRLPASTDASRPLKLGEVNPLAWASPDDPTTLQLGRPALPPPYLEAPAFDPLVRPTKKRAATRIPSKIYNSNPRFSTQSR